MSDPTSDETPAERAPDLLDGQERSLDPRVRTVWMIGRALVPVVLLGIPAVVLQVVGERSWASLVGALALVGVLAELGWAHLLWSRWRWSAWGDALDLRHGVVIRRESLVPYHRIQQIDVERGPLERMLGLSSLVLRTAAASTDATLPGVAAEQAQELRHRLLERAGQDDAV